MDRRQFLARSTAVLGATTLMPAVFATPTDAAPPGRSGRSSARRLSRIGLELYSVRDAMKKDPERTLAAVRAMGYTDVELLWSFNNFGRSPKQVKIALDGEGLRAPSAHIDPRLLQGDWERALADAKYLGHEYLIAPSIPGTAEGTLDGWRAWADLFNTSGEKARKAGIWLAFHNEPNHQKPVEGVVPYDLFLERTDPSLVRHQLDVGNMAMGGGDPLAYVTKHVDRYWSFHIKDVVADRSRDTDLGEGTVDLRAILAAIPEIDRKPVYVEQEGSADPMASAKRDCDYLKRLDF